MWHRGQGGAERGVHSFMPCVGNITVTVSFMSVCSQSVCGPSHARTHTAAVCLSHTAAKPLHVQVGQTVNGWGYFGAHIKPL